MFDKISLGYDHSLSSCNTSSYTLNRVIFVPPTNNDKFEETDPKIENVSEGKPGKGNSILRAPHKIKRKRLSKIIIALLARSLNRRSHISAITVEHPGTFNQIAISG